MFEIRRNLTRALLDVYTLKQGELLKLRTGNPRNVAKPNVIPLCNAIPISWNHSTYKKLCTCLHYYWFSQSPYGYSLWIHDWNQKYLITLGKTLWLRIWAGLSTKMVFRINTIEYLHLGFWTYRGEFVHNTHVNTIDGTFSPNTSNFNVVTKLITRSHVCMMQHCKGIFHFVAFCIANADGRHLKWNVF